MWTLGGNGKWVCVAAATATSAFFLTTNLGILRGAIVSWRARKLPRWPTSTLGGNIKQLFRSNKSFHQMLKAGADELGPLFSLRIVCFTVSSTGRSASLTCSYVYDRREIVQQHKQYKQPISNSSVGRRQTNKQTNKQTIAGSRFEWVQAA